MMNREEKLELIADILEVEVDEVVEDKELDEYDTWDSVAVLTVISIMNEKFNKFPHANEIREYSTVGKLMEAMKND